MVKHTRSQPTFNALLACFLWTASCSWAGAQTTSSPVLSALARTYLESVLTLAQTNSINRSQVDWPTVRREVFSRAGGAQIGPIGFIQRSRRPWRVVVLRTRRSQVVWTHLREDPQRPGDPPGRSPTGSSFGWTDDGELWRGHRDCIPWPSVDAFVWGNDPRADDLQPRVPSFGRLVAEFDDCRFCRPHGNAIPEWRDAGRALDRPTRRRQR